MLFLREASIGPALHGKNKAGRVTNAPIWGCKVCPGMGPAGLSGKREPDAQQALHKPSRTLLAGFLQTCVTHSLFRELISIFSSAQAHSQEILQDAHPFDT